ncbi:MAG: fused MFS/spermidine synthase [Geobacter sp.]|nr:fused MFS/spermidine synthase [Geobacter sp.]
MTPLLFVLFFVSGFCALLYQVVWVRLAFASFGIITPVISVVISVFMLGLALGSWAGGKLISLLARRTNLSAIFFYACAEAVIGIGAFVVPALLVLGETILLHMGEANSFFYLLSSAIAITLALFPWTVFMGATFPLVMAYVKECNPADTQSFSFLYLANVFGAMFGTLLTAMVFVELLGFRHTLWVAGIANFSIAGLSVAIGLRSANKRCHSEKNNDASPATIPTGKNPFISVILFTTGFCSLAMEVVWTRAFTPVLGTQVYSFAELLFVYLLCTWFGSHVYRRDLKNARVRPVAHLLTVLAVAAFLPILLNDPHFSLDADLRIFLVLASISPFCAALGYLTPHLIDECAAGDPRLAGKAYALNVLGCILGPLLSSYVLLPLLGANLTLVALGAPFLVFCFVCYKDISRQLRFAAGPAAGIFLLGSFFVDFENPDGGPTKSYEIRRDHTATVISAGKGLQKKLYVNGISITHLTSITKYMAHLPLAFHQGRPESGLVICFGMGTSYRSLLSWGVQATSVELVPSVKQAFPYYHANAEALLKHPRGRIVIDDGRRYLNRTIESFDVIIVDPPPPIEAAGSSLLYSKQFHEAVRRHLKPGGIFQTWFPGGETSILQAITRSLVEVFPYVKIYTSVDGWGVHLLASMSPLETPTPEEMVSRLPVQAKKDLLEWSHKGLNADISSILANEIPVAELLSLDRSIVITDDRPYNEYFLLRRASNSASAPAAQGKRKSY